MHSRNSSKPIADSQPQKLNLLFLEIKLAFLPFIRSRSVESPFSSNGEALLLLQAEAKERFVVT